MTVKELYCKLEKRIPRELSCDWDNDGVMCSHDLSCEVRKVLVSLDVTEEIVDYAIERGFDLIISHHPLIFKPLNNLNEENHVSRKVIKLLTNGVSVFSFHTRLDRAEGGVNDLLCDELGLKNVSPFGEDGLGRIGSLCEDRILEDFANDVKISLGADGVRFADAYNPVRRVAVVGGDGKDFVRDALAEGADTFLSGRLSYNVMEEAAEMGINLIEAGHYFTEFPITGFLSSLISSFDENIYVEIANSNVIKLV